MCVCGGGESRIQSQSRLLSARNYVGQKEGDQASKPSWAFSALKSGMINIQKCPSPLTAQVCPQNLEKMQTVLVF